MARRRKSLELGLVADVAALWGLAERLARASALGDAYRACLACRVTTCSRSAVRAGRAAVGMRLVTLHNELFRPGREADRDETFLHECAHILTELHYGKTRPHGPEWRATMTMLGEEPRAGHQFPYLSHEANAVCIWTCVSCGERHFFLRRPRRPVDRYSCPRCGRERGKFIETLRERRSFGAPEIAIMGAR